MKALSIRQPWAYMILHCGKDIENRDWSTGYRGRVLIHASKGMTRNEWISAWDWAKDMGLSIRPPPIAIIERGGIVGSVEIVDCVTDSDSEWFCGTYGFVLRNPIILPFKPYKGQLGFFEISQKEEQQKGGG